MTRSKRLKKLSDREIAEVFAGHILTVMDNFFDGLKVTWDAEKRATFFETLKARYYYWLTEEEEND